MSAHKYNMGVVGNCAYIAYIDTMANVKWLCLPRFDSSFIFGSLLDKDKGGHFYICPSTSAYKSKQYYLVNTNILCTEFETSEGSFRVIDCAPRMQNFERQFKPLMLVRKIEHLKGEPSIIVSCKPTGNYGQIIPEAVTGSNHIGYLNLPSPVRLTTDVAINYVLQEQPFVLDQDKYLILTYGEPMEAPLKHTAEEFIAKTASYWEGWVKSCYLPNLYQEEVIRSALILKLHQYEDTGGIIASGTTSLPEFHDSTRNWDYRYCWFRDTYYTLKAFNQIGHFEELEKYFDYVQNILRNAGEYLQPLYSVTGEENLFEVELELEGYQGNKPVRIGNKAYEQVQNDVYGQVLVSLLPLYIDKRLTFKRKSSYSNIVSWLLQQIERTMHIEDAGLWEFRNSKQFHTYTILFHWAGAKSAFKIASVFGDTKLMATAKKIELEAKEKIEKCYDENRKVYTQGINSANLDASTLMMITMNYLDPDSEIARLHIMALEAELLTPQGLFYRYKHSDDFGMPESTFLVCAFWYVDALACVGRVADARKILEQLLLFSNHLGLFSEDVGEDGSQWGNFPQTYSHVGLINAVCRIAKKIDSPEFL